MLCPLLVLPPFENELLYCRRRPPLHGRPGLGLSYSAHLFRCPLLKINPCIAGGGPHWPAGGQGCRAPPLIVLPPLENKLLYCRRRPPLASLGPGLPWFALLFCCPHLKRNSCIAGCGSNWSSGVQGCHALPSYFVAPTWKWTPVLQAAAPSGQLGSRVAMLCPVRGEKRNRIFQNKFSTTEGKLFYWLSFHTKEYVPLYRKEGTPMSSLAELTFAIETRKLLSKLFRHIVCTTSMVCTKDYISMIEGTELAIVLQRCDSPNLS